MRKFRARWPEIHAFTSAGAVLISGSCAAAEIKDYIDRTIKGKAIDGISLWSVLGYFSVFVLAICWLYGRRRIWTHPQTRELRNETPIPREHLILFLSNLPLDGGYREGIPQGIALGGDLTEDLNTLIAYKKQRGNVPWRWEMPLRAIRHHLGTLQTITIICSPESLTQVHWFGNILKRYTHLLKFDPEAVSSKSMLDRIVNWFRWLIREPVPSEFLAVPVRVWTKQGKHPCLMGCPPTEPQLGGGWDFEQFDDLSWGLRQLLLCLKKQGIQDHQIMIDFTGGNKVASVVAASVTFNRRIKAQYVQTNEPFEVIGYDIIIGTMEAEGTGV